MLYAILFISQLKNSISTKLQSYLILNQILIVFNVKIEFSCLVVMQILVYQFCSHFKILFDEQNSLEQNKKYFIKIGPFDTKLLQKVRK